MNNNLLDIKLQQFTEKEVDAMLKKGKAKKVADIDKIRPEIWKLRKFWTHFSDYEIQSIKKT